MANSKKSNGRKWSPAQREKWSQTLQAKRAAQVMPVIAQELQLIERSSLDINPEVVADRKLSEIIQAAKVLGFHIEVNIRPNGKSSPTQT